MGFFDNKRGTQTAVPAEVAACDREIAFLEQRRRELHQSIGARYAAEMTVEKAAETPYAADMQELEKLTARGELLQKRRLAVQGQRLCEKCGNVLSLDSAFCNKCGGKLEPIAPEVLTDKALCPQCKSPVEPGVAFCTKCGAKLAEVPVEEPAGAVQSEAAKCPKCGEVSKPGMKFCIKCGTRLTE